MGLDWGDGDYGRIAGPLMPAAEALAEFAGVVHGDSVLDVGCGTGNASLAAAARGAHVTGVDPSPGLLEEAARRAVAAGLGPRTEFVVGRAEALPFVDARFAVALSTFGVIFADDPSLALSEMVRVTRPGGTVALATWLPEGAIAEAGRILRRAVPAPEGPVSRWDDPDWVGALLRGHGTREPEARYGELSFRGESPEAWLAEQVEHHPAWRSARRAIDEAAWERVRRDAVAALAAANEAGDSLLVTSRYAMLRAERPG
jgi:ubiquinone/menaquinone biosynthesis C-methylase UbiE